VAFEFFDCLVEFGPGRIPRIALPLEVPREVCGGPEEEVEELRRGRRRHVDVDALLDRLPELVGFLDLVADRPRRPELL
jgi:hypothetical protein